MLDRYSTQEMRHLWSPENQYASWLKVEMAALWAMEQQGIVPPGTYQELEAANLKPDPAAIEEIEAVTRHDVIAFLTHMEQQGGDVAKWLHFGMTSSDMLDTSLALRLVEALDLILEAAGRLADALAKQARTHVTTLMVGRTHGIHAEPTTLGLMFAGWYAEMQRSISRVQDARNQAAYGKISGAVGTYGHLSPEIERMALERLGLKPETVSTQVVPRDRHAQVLAALAMMAGSLERFAVNLRHMQRTEVSEAFEPFGSGQKGSSAMPHKRNPILLENITGLARTVRGYVMPALENMALWHERDISHSSVERVILPDATSLMQFALLRMSRVIEGLDISEDRLLENLWLTKGLVFSGTVLLALVRKGVPRTRAYEAVQRAGLATYRGAGTFRQMLEREQLVTELMDPEELDRLFDLGHHLRHAREIVDRALNEKHPLPQGDS